MEDILELPEVRACVSRMSVEQYHQTPELNENGKRTELIRGIVIEKMSKSPLHSSICSKLFRQIVAVTPEGYLARKDEPITTIDSEPEPDVFVVAGADADFETHHPATAELAIEVAFTSLRLDRQKAFLYAEAGVKEYWIVIAERQEVEVYRQAKDGRYRDIRTYSREDTISCASVPQIQLEIARLFPGPAGA